MQGSYKLLVKNAKQLVMITKNHEKMLCGKAMNDIAVINDAYIIYRDCFISRSIVVDKNGIIAAVGPTCEICEQFKAATFEREIDATGNLF